MIQDVLAFAEKHIIQGECVVLLTVTETDGSSPASTGQFMAVLADGQTAGTVGGGASEFRLIRRAQEAIEKKEQVFEFAFDHAESGMACGGAMKGFGNVLGNENHLYIFGGGHVSQQLAPLAQAAGFFVTVIEDRPEFEENFSDVCYVVSSPDEYQEKIRLSGSSYVVICTRGHRTDDEALRFALGCPTAYLGMIGSQRKVDTIFDQLRKENYPPESLDAIYAPIGLDIASGAPAEIAVSILAEILMVKNHGTPAHKKDVI